MPITLDDLPNELLDHITHYIEHWSLLPPRLSVYGILSGVNRRLRAFALPRYFSTVCLPVRATSERWQLYGLEPGPLGRLDALLSSHPSYKTYIRHINVGPKQLPSMTVEWQARPELPYYAKGQHTDTQECFWHYFDSEQTSDSSWDLLSFVSFIIHFGPSTLPFFYSCENLRRLCIRWDDQVFPDLSCFPRLEEARLEGRAISRAEYMRTWYRAPLAKPCLSLERLAVHGGIAIPFNFVKHLHELYPNLRVLSVIRAALAAQDILHSVGKHLVLEEVNAQFVPADAMRTCRLENLVKIISGLERDWPFNIAAGTKVFSPVEGRHAGWTELIVSGFAFARERRTGRRASDHDPLYDITSLALQYIEAEYQPGHFDILLALLQTPAKFPYKHIRHLALSCYDEGLLHVRPVDDFLAHLGVLLSDWDSLETFTLHHDLTEKTWPHRIGAYVPVLDDMYVPTDRAMLEGFDRALWSCLQHLPQRQKKHVLEELGRIAGREIDKHLLAACAHWRTGAPNCGNADYTSIRIGMRRPWRTRSVVPTKGLDARRCCGRHGRIACRERPPHS
ncbi:uncharacterized protein SCHCODRAFT_02536672 [Schizophyllum commune H4-8]|uniref:uncharacterized protein n=1 Tax=Schizophyllum commune (strain H4-8 / FGSC 9210) TaxID=578458 RepID=UPI002160F20C|nr:uncharacterized protein SCHCODRAFT_02536672 [Schizophyllum commune H4-8]KAI5895520.1 hypothetical protein SCHCODRAFT_02536672 [Schizophyllum commune H4-8]